MTTTRLSSGLLLAGILMGFLGATWAGHLAAGYSKPSNFRRFHQRISPDTLYYPPYAMLENLALARWQPGRTLVIIGGNSVLNGVGQPADDVWSLRLQEQLGDAYVVVNLALRGAAPTQGAALVAEALLARGLPVVFVANTQPYDGSGQAAGGPYGYLYWQARSLGRLTAFAARDASISQWLEARPAKERTQQAEERLGARLEPWFRPQSLWHHIGYRHLFTVWNFVLGRDSFSPRVRLPDNEPDTPPVENRFQNYLTEEMAIVRGSAAALLVQGQDGHWQLEEGHRQRLAAGIEAAFVPSLRPHTLMLLSQNASYYRERLSPAERERDAQAYAACAQLWREHGIACEIAGAGFVPADYIDRAHLSPDGGLKLAFLLAEKIRQMNHP